MTQREKKEEDEEEVNFWMQLGINGVCCEFKTQV